MRLLVAGLVGGAMAAGLAAPASAQVPTVATDGTLAEPAAPPPAAPAPPPQPIIITTPAQPGAQNGEAAPAVPGAAAPSSGYYHTDDLGGPSADSGSMATGAGPDVHVVRSGDTLWDLCWAYFNNPWDWPRIWSYNPEITNPHWIYPGDEVRMRQPGAGPSAAPRSTGRGRTAAGRATDHPLGLRQLAFVANDDLDLRFQIDGSTDEKLLLAAGDEVYLSYPRDRSPRVGMRYAIYLPKETVRHPTRDEEVGAFVRVVGEVEVISAARGKRARGVLVDTVDVIERGMAVGPVTRQFKDVASTPAVTDLEAIIVADVLSVDLIGQLQVVFLDRGSADRLRVGNHLDVIRRGDAYPENMSPPGGIGQNDRRYPARLVGELVVVQTGRHSAIAVVVRSDKELGVGDRARLSRTRNRRPE
jgi:hypothetical protein